MTTIKDPKKMRNYGRNEEFEKAEQDIKKRDEEDWMLRWKVKDEDVGVQTKDEPEGMKAGNEVEGSTVNAKWEEMKILIGKG